MADNNDDMQMHAQAQPNPDLKQLDWLVGTWTVSDPSGANAISGKVTYEWLPGGYFLKATHELEQYGQKIQATEIIGHLQAFGEEPQKAIKSRNYDNMGNSLDFEYEVDGNTMTIWGGEKGSPAYFKGERSEDGDTQTGGWVYPGGGGYKSSMTRVK